MQFKKSVNLCKVLAGGKSNPLMAIFISMVAKIMKLPSNTCPIYPGVYYISDIHFPSELFPLYLFYQKDEKWHAHVVLSEKLPTRKTVEVLNLGVSFHILKLK